MDMPIRLDKWSTLDTKLVENGYTVTSVPDLTHRNFLLLLDEYNKLLELSFVMAKRLGINVDELL